MAERHPLTVTHHWQRAPLRVIRWENMTAPAQTMNCPACGAPVPAGATTCDHCGSRLAVVACPSCFGMVFAGAKFCSHCGAAISRQEVQTSAEAPCPRCQVTMEAVLIGK